MDDSLIVLLDQNVPYSVLSWLPSVRPAWTAFHAADVGLGSALDGVVYTWAQAHAALVATFDEDFADRRSFTVGKHAGIIRLRVWPTTAEETTLALRRLFEQVTVAELRGALVIIDRTRIRVRPIRPNSAG